MTWQNSGRNSWSAGLVESQFGNMSVLAGSRMLITKSGCALDEITGKSVVEVDIDKPSSHDNIASSESPIHRVIYKNTTAP